MPKSKRHRFNHCGEAEARCDVEMRGRPLHECGLVVDYARQRCRTCHNEKFLNHKLCDSRQPLGRVRDLHCFMTWKDRGSSGRTVVGEGSEWLRCHCDRDL